MEKKKYQGYFDYALLVIVIFLVAFGLVMLYSTSSYMSQVEYDNPRHYLNLQLRNTLIGVAAFLIGITVDYHKWYKIGAWWFVIAIVAVASVWTPLGYAVNGARRWINIGVGNLQPAELAKVALIMFCAILLNKLGKQIDTLKAALFLIIAVGIVAVEVWLLNDNMSTAIIIFGIGIVMFFVASSKMKPFVVIAGTGVAGVAALVWAITTGQIKGGFRSERILAWLNPEQYASDTAFQTIQSLYAIGSGGIFGKGLGNSIQKLGFIPEAQNDMIFSIICEELGLFGAISIILVFAAMIWRFMIISANAPDYFGAMLVVGVMAHIAIQVVLNIAVVTNTIPNTGVTLPFISYGGTSIMFLLFEMGLVLNVSSQIRIKM